MDPETIKAFTEGAKSIPSTLKEIYRTKLSDLPGKVVNLQEIAPFRYRFIDCSSYVKDKILRLLQHEPDGTLEGIPYAAISYVWKGLRPTSPTASFHVSGAESADPVGIDVLRHACLLSLKFKQPLLWLDRLGICQTNPEDKDWQIRNMHGIYKHCHACVILTGGLHTLSTLEEPAEGDWINRSWTLQEAVAPKMALCLFASQYGEGFLYASEASVINSSEKSRFEFRGRYAHDVGKARVHVYRGQLDETPIRTFDPDEFRVGGDDTDGLFAFPGLVDTMLEPERTYRIDVRELEKGTSVYLGLSDVLRVVNPLSYPLVYTARMYRTPNLQPGKFAHESLDTRCFEWTRGSSAASLHTLLLARLRKDDLEPDVFPSMSEIVTGNKEILSAAEIDEWRDRTSAVDLASVEDEWLQDRVRSAIWQSAIARRTSRPVDSVLSVMGLFDIPLDPQRFHGLKHPRLASTITLAREYLKRGGRAFWLSSFFKPGVGRRKCRTDKRMCSMPPMAETRGAQDSNGNYNPQNEQTAPSSNITDLPTGSMDDAGYLTISVPSVSVKAGQTLLLKGAEPTRWAEDTLIIFVGESSYTDSSAKHYFDTMHHLLALHEHAPGKHHIVDAFSCPAREESEMKMYTTREVTVGGPSPVSDIWERRKADDPNPSPDKYATGPVEEPTSHGSAISDATWKGLSLPKGFDDVTEEVDVKGLDMLNYDSRRGDAKTLFKSSKPSSSSSNATEWVESDADDQLMLFIPFQSTLKVHTIHLTSLPPGDDDDEVVRPRTVHVYPNRTVILGFDDAEDIPATHTVTLGTEDWDRGTGTAKVELPFVKFQRVTSLTVFVEDGEGDGEKVRLDRIRVIGKSGEKRDMGRLEKNHG